MATIIFEGVIQKDSVKDESGKIYFRVAESIGTKDDPQYNNFDCGWKCTDKQKEHVRAGKIVNVVGEYVTKVNKVGEKTYYNTTIYCDRIKFKGDVKPKEETQTVE